MLETCIYIYILEISFRSTILACNCPQHHVPRIHEVEFTKFLGRFITAWPTRGNSNERGAGGRFILDSSDAHVYTSRHARVVEGEDQERGEYPSTASLLCLITTRNSRGEPKVTPPPSPSLRGQSKLHDVVKHTPANSRYTTGITNAFSTMG